MRRGALCRVETSGKNKNRQMVATYLGMRRGLGGRIFVLFFRATDDGDGTETSHERSAGVKLSRPTDSLPAAVCAWATASKG